MEYSVKEVISKINEDWFLPAIQRPYVWGSRYEEEKYICRLFDSLLREYPIGLLILWKPNKMVAFRRFIQDYEDDNAFKPKDEQDFKMGSSLVYDGQQRLQTLFSCLKFSFKNRVLVFNLCYKHDDEEEGQDTGFRFVDDNASLGKFDIRMTRVFNIQDDDDKCDLRDEIKAKTENRDEKRLIERNLDKLYNVFADVKHKSPSINVFEIQGVNDNEVNEIFQRLNMGGVQLSNADLLFSRIKEVTPRFESDIIEFTKKISEKDNPTISAYDVLQIIHIIVKGQTKINPEFSKGDKGREERKQFVDCWESLKTPLQETMVKYLSVHLKINRIQIVPRKMPLLALIVYMYHLYKSGGNITDQARQTRWLQRVDKFFITAELNDWSLQSYVDNFSKIFSEQQNKKDFPLEAIFEWVNNKRNRFVDISEKTFCDNKWFALKVVLKDSRYSFKDDMSKRFNPELDHIFPVHLKDTDEEYRKTVDIVWNMQPVTGDINIDKSNFHPQEYFLGKVKNHEFGKDYYKEYKEIPPLDSPLWDDYKQFVQFRKERFIELMKQQYDIVIKSEKTEDNSKQDSIVNLSEELRKTRERAETVLKKHIDNPSESLAHFIRQCESSQNLEEGGLNDSV